jgi:hypothetical protein
MQSAQVKVGPLYIETGIPKHAGYIDRQPLTRGVL